MPRFDGTGPNGAGPMTGRGMGNCGQGQGFGRGRGFGRRNCCPFADSIDYPTSQERLDGLKESQKKINAEIEKLEKEQK